MEEVEEVSDVPDSTQSIKDAKRELLKAKLEARKKNQGRKRGDDAGIDEIVDNETMEQDESNGEESNKTSAKESTNGQAVMEENLSNIPIVQESIGKVTAVDSSSSNNEMKLPPAKESTDVHDSLEEAITSVPIVQESMADDRRRDEKETTEGSNSTDEQDASEERLSSVQIVQESNIVNEREQNKHLPKPIKLDEEEDIACETKEENSGETSKVPFVDKTKNIRKVATFKKEVASRRKEPPKEKNEIAESFETKIKPVEEIPSKYMENAVTIEAFTQEERNKLKELFRVFNNGLLCVFNRYATSHGLKNGTFGAMSEQSSQLHFPKFYRMAKDFGIAHKRGMNQWQLKHLFNVIAKTGNNLVWIGFKQFRLVLVHCANVLLSRSPWCDRYTDIEHKLRALFLRMDLGEDKRASLLSKMQGFGGFHRGDGKLATHAETRLPENSKAPIKYSKFNYDRISGKEGPDGKEVHLMDRFARQQDPETPLENLRRQKQKQTFMPTQSPRRNRPEPKSPQVNQDLSKPVKNEFHLNFDAEKELVKQFGLEFNHQRGGSTRNDINLWNEIDTIDLPLQSKNCDSAVNATTTLRSIAPFYDGPSKSPPTERPPQRVNRQKFRCKLTVDTRDAEPTGTRSKSKPMQPNHDRTRRSPSNRQHHAKLVSPKDDGLKRINYFNRPPGYVSPHSPRSPENKSIASPKSLCSFDPNSSKNRATRKRHPGSPHSPSDTSSSYLKPNYSERAPPGIFIE